MDFRILGPLEIHDGRRTLDVGGGRQRKLLAMLLLSANEVVSTDRLIDELWGDRPPETAAKALQGYVSQLRRLLGHETLVTQSPGYLLRVEPEQLDAHRFERLVAEAHELEPKKAAAKLREALRLWSGSPLPEFAFDRFAQDEIARLEELRLFALEERVAADLALGRHAELVGELQGLASQHPLREGFGAGLMLALYRSGRQAEALEAYRKIRQALVGELGLEPGEELQQLQRAILAHDPALGRPPRLVPPSPPLVEKVLRRRRWLVVVGVLLLAGAIAAASAELASGPSGSVVAVAPNSVAVIDAKTNRVVGDVPVGARPVAVAAGAGGIWVVNADDGTVSRIDPRTRKVVSTIGVGGDVSDVAVGFGSVWVANGNDGTLSRIDPRLNTVERTLRFGGNGLAPQPVFSVATGAGGVWLSRGNRVLKIDPVTNQVTASIPVQDPLGIAAGESAVWITTRGEQLVRIGPATGAATASVSLPRQAIAPLVVGGSLWLIVMFSDHDEVWRLDSSTGTPEEAIVASSFLSDVAWSPAAVWATERSGALLRISPKTNETTIIRVGLQPTGVAVSEGDVWVSVEPAS